MEEIEKHDWKIDVFMSDAERYEKSVSAYYLPEWYDLIADLTFETEIYPIDHPLEVLPFEKNMVRYEHKSPKDSEYWTSCTTYDQIQKIFATSLTARTHPGKYLCIRKWYDISCEFRCFWNKQLVAVADHSKNQILNNSSDFNDQIITYCNTIAHRIPYIRCVIDICILKDGQIKIIEFNSWESNCGALPFNWIDDTDILYPNLTKPLIPIHFRSANQSINYTINVPNKFQTSSLSLSQSNLIGEDIVNSLHPSNWLKTEKYIYVTSDIWLALFDLNMNVKQWKRGVYRFASIVEMEDGMIMVGDKVYHPDLTPYRGMINIYTNSQVKDKINVSHNTSKFRYGILTKTNYYRFFVDAEGYAFICQPETLSQN